MTPGETTGQVKVGPWTWTVWPTLPTPTEDWLRAYGQARGARALDEYWKKREHLVAQEKLDPLNYGWEAPPIRAARELLAGTYVPGQFGPVCSDGQWINRRDAETPKEEFTNTETTQPGTLPAEANTEESPEGPGRDGNKPLMRNREAKEAPSPIGNAAGNPFLQPLPAADDLLLMTGNRFGKSNFGGKLVNEKMRGIVSARVRCWSQSIDTSRSVQQTAVFKHLPPHLRKVKRAGQFCKVSYTAATGFTEETFLYPQGTQQETYTQCWFLTYHSWQQDKTIAEGPGVTLTWCDEEVPAELLDTLRYRVGDTSKMLLLVTFTPITGYTEAVGQYIEGARVIECVPARRVVFDWWQRSWSWGEWLLPPDKELVEGLPPGHVPFLLEHTQVPGRYTLCAATAWNPYVDVEEVFKKSINQPLETKLIRWFGWPLRKVRPALSFYDAHVVPPWNVPPLGELTIYLVVDPCPPPRNWFMVWLGVDRDGRVWVLAEWPDLEVGEWAIPGTEPDGKPGPGAYDGGGRGFDGYKLLILEREGWVCREGEWKPGTNYVQVRDGDRYLDPRAASWKVPSQQDEEAKSYIDCLLEPVTRLREGRPVRIAPGLDFLRAPAAHIQEGNELINDWLTQGWDPKERLTPLNAPRFYINRGVLPEDELVGRAACHPFLRGGCRNTIWALRTFTGKKRSGKNDDDSACKDPIDCLKGAAKAGVRYVAPGAFGSYGRAGAGY